MAAATKKSGGKKKAGGGKTSAYNKYMKVQLAKLKEEDAKAGKKSDHKANFSKVASSWATAAENPKNKA